MPEPVQMNIPEDVVVLISLVPSGAPRRTVTTMYIKLHEMGYSFSSAKEAVIRIVQQIDDMGNVSADTIALFAYQFAAEVLDHGARTISRVVAELPHSDYLPARVADTFDRLKGVADPERCLTVTDRRALARAVTAGMRDLGIYAAVIALLGPAIADAAGVSAEDRGVLLNFLEG